MNNKTTSTRKNNSVVRNEKQKAPQKAPRQSTESRYRDQFWGLALDTGCSFINAIKENAGDYKTINKDKNLSSVGKALGKRKVLLADIGLSTLEISSVFYLMWLAKKVLAA